MTNNTQVEDGTDSMAGATGKGRPAGLLIIEGDPLRFHAPILRPLLPSQGPPVSPGAVIGVEAQQVLPGLLSQAGLYAAAEDPLLEGLPPNHAACNGAKPRYVLLCMLKQYGPKK